MRRSLTSVLLYIVANGIGLLLASLLLTGFSITPFSLIFAAILLSLVEALIGPMIQNQAKKRVPALEGGIALVTTFAGLFITATFIGGLKLGGPANWLMATLLVWVGALIASMVLPHMIFKNNKKQS